MMVSVNGPLPGKSDQVVMAAMKRPFKGQNGIRFVRRSDDIRLFVTPGISKVIIDQRLEGEHYHPSWQFTRPTFSSSTFCVEYESGCCLGD